MSSSFFVNSGASNTARATIDDQVTAAQTAKTEAETAKTAAELAKTNAETAETNSASSASTATTQAGIATTQRGLADTAKTGADNAKTGAENARDTAIEYATKAEDQNITGGTDKSALHYAAKAAASATAAAQSATDATAVTVGTGQTITGAKVFSANADFGAGIDVTGTVTATGLNVTTSNTEATVNVGTNYLNVIGSDATSGLKLSNTNNTTDGQSDILFSRTENPVVNDQNTGIGSLLFQADNANGQFLFGSISAFATNFTAGSETAFINVALEDGTGSKPVCAQFNKQGIALSDSKRMGFGVSSDRGNNYLGQAQGFHYDLEVFHDGSNSYVKDYGTGNLVLQGAGVSIRDTSGNRRVFAGDGSTGKTNLYYGDNATPKLTTEFSGAKVAGTLEADGIRVGDDENISLGNGNELIIKHHSGGGSSITETGGGNLALVGNAVTINNGTGTNETQIVCDGSGTTNRTKLYSGQPSDSSDYKLSTTPTGVDVKGTVTATGLNVTTGNTEALINVGTSYLKVTGSDATSGLKLENTSSTTDGQPDILFSRTQNPVVNDQNTGIGSLLFQADNANGQFLFGSISAFANNFTDGSETAFINIALEDGTGSKPVCAQFNKQGIALSDSKRMGFGVSSDRGNNYLGDPMGFHYDLEVFHDGNNSYVRDYGTGNLVLQGAGVSIRDTSGNRRVFAGDGNTGKTSLYYGDNVTPVLTTESTGVNVAGGIVATGGSTIFRSTDTTGQFIIENTTDDANGAPDLHLRRTVDTPADGDVVGSLVSEARTVNSDGTLSSQKYLSRLITTLTDSGGTAGNAGASDGLYAAKLDIQVSKTGSEGANIQTLTPDRVTFHKPITVTGTVTADGLTMGNNEKIILGNPAALEIFHTGGNSFIDDIGAGVLNLRSSNRIVLTGKDTGETLAAFNENGQTQLYHNGVMHFNTDANGIAVTGKVTASSDLVVTDNTKGVVLKSPNGTLYRLKVANDGTLSTETA